MEEEKNMKISDLFKRRARRKYIQLEYPIVDKCENARLAELENNHYALENGSDLPTIQFGSKKCIIALGQWMNMLSNFIVVSCANETLCTRLSADELYKKNFVQYEKLEEVSKEFARLLVEIGISATEKIIVNEFEEEEGLLKCHFETLNKDIDMRYCYGHNGIHPKLTLQKGKKKLTYSYSEGNAKKPRHLWLADYTKVNAKTGVSLFRSFESSGEYHATITDGLYQSKIQIKYSNDAQKSKAGYVNFDKLETTLMEMRMPQQIDTIFEMVQSNLLCGYGEVEHIFIQEVKKEDITKKVPNDKISSVSPCVNDVATQTDVDDAVKLTHSFSTDYKK